MVIKKTSKPFKVPCGPVHRFFLAALLLSVACGAAPKQNVFGHAVMLADKGRHDEAVAALDAHLHTHPTDVRARRLLIRMLGFSGNLGRASNEATRLAKDLGPSSPIPWVELGFALELSHRYDEALERYDQAALVAPRDPLGPRTGGLRAARWGEHDIARPRLEDALRRNPKDAEVWHALGVVCLALGDLEAADRAYLSGLMADPRALENRVGLATVALVREDPGAALVQYDAILSERPKHADAKLGRAWALGELGRLDEALRALDEAKRLGADPAIVRRQENAIAERRAVASRADEKSSPSPTTNPDRASEPAPAR